MSILKFILIATHNYSIKDYYVIGSIVSVEK